MQCAIVLYDRFTALDAMGPYEVLTRTPGIETVLVADKAGPVTNDLGNLTVVAAASFDDVPEPDIIVVPGGPGQTAQAADGPLANWLRRVDRTSTWTTSVCTGALILATAGLLSGRRANTHWLATDQLAEHGVTHSPERFVKDGKYITAAGVSAGIDMALTLAAEIAGDESAQAVQLIIEYAPEPPFHAGNPATAPKPVYEALEARRADIRAGTL